MIVTAHGATYVWKGAFEERGIPETHGFTWEEPGQWQTQRHGIAAKLKEHFDAAASSLAARAAESASLDSDFKVPSNPGCEFLPYQRAGVKAIRDRFLDGKQVLLGDEMRLGKSVQTVGLINVMHDIWRVLVVCPATIKLDWAAKIKTWSTIPFSVGVIWPSTIELPKANILIVNYDLLHRWVWPQVDLLVVDEAHLVKTPTTRRAKKTFAIRATHKLFLTGTPVLSRPIELYPLLKALAPKDWPSMGAFGVRYCGGFVDERGWDFTGASNSEELCDRLKSTVMVRRLRSEVWKDLPPVRREVIELPIDGGPARKCLEREEKLKHDFTYEAQVNGLAAGRRRAFEQCSVVRHESALAKAPQVVEFIKDAMEGNEEKVVIFAWHKDVIDALMRGLSPFCPLCVTGDTPVPERQQNNVLFLTEKTHRLFVGNIVAAGLGLDLSVASRVIFAELDWTPGNMRQCEDRCQNVAKRDTVLVQHLVLEGSIDANMARALVRKQDILDRTLDGKEDDSPLDIAGVFGLR